MRLLTQIFSASFLTLCAVQSLAATVTVTSTTDVADGTTSTIAALIASPGPDGVISLREAIIAANNTANSGGPDEIHFAIAGAGPHTLQPTSALPTLSDPVLVDGNNGGGDRVFIDGSSAGNVIGLRLAASDITVTNLVLQNFLGASSEGIRIHDGTNRNTISNCLIQDMSLDGIRVDWLGADTDLDHAITGCTVSGSGHDGIVLVNVDGISVTGCIIEGSTRHGMNIVGGNNGSGGNLVASNTIRGNGSQGVSIWDNGSSGNTFHSNIIHSNNSSGISVGSGGNDTKIFHNVFDANGTGVSVNAGVTGVIARNTLFTNNSGYGLNDGGGGASTSVDYCGFFDNGSDACNFDCLTGSQNITVDPLYAAPGPPTNFGLTECTSPAIHAGLDLGGDQPDMNGGDPGLFTGTAPDIGAFESSCSDLTNTPPSADSGGPYAIAEGQELSLDASATFDPDGDPLSWDWDLDDDGTFGDVQGETVLVNWATLAGLDIDDDGTYTLGLQVDDGQGGVVTATTTLTVANTPPTLSTTGNDTILAGDLYTLNLAALDPGDDTITGWTIFWGDGDTTSTGAVNSVTHIYSLPGLSYQILAAATDEDGRFLQNELLVAGYQTGEKVFRVEPNSGNILQLFGSTTDGLSEPYQAILGPDGNIYVSGQDSDNVLRYLSDGTFDKVFVAPGSGGLDLPLGLTFGPDGNLFVTSTGTHQVLRYDGSTGVFIDAFVTAGSGGLNGPSGLLFGSDGRLYVSSFNSNQVLRFNGISGGFIDIFAAGGGLLTPEAVTFGPDGNLYVADITNHDVKKFNGSNGAFIEVFASGGGLSGATGLAFAPDGHLYVGSFNTHNVLRYDATTGAHVDEFVSAGASGLTGPTYLNFVPQQQVQVLGTYEISGLVFEDVDFAGTAANWDMGTNDVASPGVDVELYTSGDVYLISTTTNAGGYFSFSGLADGDYKVRVRSATLGEADTPPAGGLNPSVPGTWPYPLAEMTWGHGSPLIGGQDQAVDDTATGDNAGPGDTYVQVSVAGADETGVNFGFNYELITNTDDDVNADSIRSKQGGLRQFIKNSNAITGVNKSWFLISSP